MNYLSNDTVTSLRQAFLTEHKELQINSDHVVVQNSQDLTKEKVNAIVQAAGFCPLVSSRRVSGDAAFTIMPYKAPSFFNAPVLQKMIPINVKNNEEKCKQVAEVLKKEISVIQSFGSYSAILAASSEIQRKIAAGSAMANGTFRYAQVFENEEPIKIRWMISPDVVIIAVPQKLFEQHGRRYFESYQKVDKTFWLCSEGNYFLTMRPSSEEDKKMGFWKGSVEERTLYWQKEFIEKDLFGSWIDHWDCIKGGMTQPFRMNPMTGRANFSYKSGGVFTFSDLLDPNILGKDPDVFKNNPHVFKKF